MRPLHRILTLAVSLLLLTVVVLSLEKPAHAAAELEYDFTKIGLYHSNWSTRQSDEHSSHLRLIGEQQDLPVVVGTNFNSRIQSSLTHSTRSFSFDVPQTNWYQLSLTGALSLDGGYGDIFLHLADQDHPVKIFSDFDFYKSDSSSFRTEATEQWIRIPAGTHMLTFEVKGKSSGTGTVWMYPNRLTLAPAEVSPNPAFIVKGDAEDLVLQLPVASSHVTGVTYGSGNLIPGTDYYLTSGPELIVSSDYLNSLDYGTQVLTFSFEQGVTLNGEIIITEPLPKTIEYDFSHLSLTEPSEWYITKLNPTQHPVVTLQGNGARIHTSMRVPVRSFSFYVDEAGLYDFEFTGNLVSASGTADFYWNTDDLEMGGLKIIEGFNFHRSGSETTRTVQTATPLYFTEGMHKLTLKLTSDGPGSTVGYTYPKSIKLTKLPNSVIPGTQTFDVSQPLDLIFTMEHHEDASLTGIVGEAVYGDVDGTFDGEVGGAYALVLGQDYTVDGSTITISQEYLSNLPLGERTLEFQFSGKNNPVATIQIVDTRPVISPDAVSFNKHPLSQADIVMSISTNGHTFERLRNQTQTLVRDRDYTLFSGRLVLKKEYLARLQAGEYELVAHFQGICVTPLQLTVLDTRSTISPHQVVYAMGNPAQPEIVITLLPDSGAGLDQIRYGGAALSLGQDYLLVGDQVTLRNSFLSNLPNGVRILTFVMSDGSEPRLQIHVIENESPEASILSLTAVLEEGVVTVEGIIDTGENRQVTIRVNNPDDELEYIAQTVSGPGGVFGFTYLQSRTIPGTYSVFVGGDHVAEPEATTFTHEPSSPPAS